jgi:hypothetical protein
MIGNMIFSLSFALIIAKYPQINFTLEACRSHHAHGEYGSRPSGGFLPRSPGPAAEYPLDIRHKLNWVAQHSSYTLQSAMHNSINQTDTPTNPVYGLIKRADGEIRLL